MIRLYNLLTLLIFIACGSTALAEGNNGKNVVTGEVLETMNAAGYTYLLVKNAYGQQWAAIPESEVKVHDQVSYYQGMVMKDFYSNTLDRTFDTIIFSSGLADSKSAPAKPAKLSDFELAVQKENGLQPAQKLADSTQGSAGAVVPMQGDKIKKASGENACTVDEIFNRASELNGKKVRVRGKVLKINQGIMGRNWVHIQDGSGDPMKNTHDLVITTNEEVKEGAVLTFEGMAAANKDFGYGYEYAVLLEEGTVLD
ncbi:MAG: DNA-binding protein [Deltaproteobacteria bacterium]|nr:MAG: DNA-binding protein [Deltaproteobacteria bacterium]